MRYLYRIMQFQANYHTNCFKVKIHFGALHEIQFQEHFMKYEILS